MGVFQVFCFFPFSELFQSISFDTRDGWQWFTWRLQKRLSYQTQRGITERTHGKQRYQLDVVARLCIRMKTLNRARLSFAVQGMQECFLLAAGWPGAISRGTLRFVSIIISNGCHRYGSITTEGKDFTGSHCYHWFPHQWHNNKWPVTKTQRAQLQRSHHHCLRRVFKSFSRGFRPQKLIVCVSRTHLVLQTVLMVSPCNKKPWIYPYNGSLYICHRLTPAR